MYGQALGTSLFDLADLTNTYTALYKRCRLQDFVTDTIYKVATGCGTEEGLE